MHLWDRSFPFRYRTFGNSVSYTHLAVAMLIGLLIALFVTYRKPREYKDIAIVETHELSSLKLTTQHWCTIAAIVVVVILQIKFGSLPFAALGGLLVMFLTGAVKRKDIDEQFNEGIKLMGFIAFVMLVAGGFAQVLKDTGAVNELVDSSITPVSYTHLDVYKRQVQ